MDCPTLPYNHTDSSHLEDHGNPPGSLDASWCPLDALPDKLEMEIVSIMGVETKAGVQRYHRRKHNYLKVSWVDMLANQQQLQIDATRILWSVRKTLVKKAVWSIVDNISLFYGKHPKDYLNISLN